MLTTRLNTVVLFASLALVACSTPASVAPGDGPHSETTAKIVTNWQMLYDVRVEGGRRVRHLIGYLEHQHPVDEPTGGKYFVLDVDRVRLGFVLPLGGAYRYRFEDGDLVGTDELGPGGLGGGIGRVLGVQIEELEYAPITEPPGDG